MDPQQPLQFPSKHAPPPGSTVEVAPGVHWLRMALPFALDHINLWLLEDGPGWTIVDCGIDDDATRQSWDAIFTTRLQDRPVTRLLVTHYHPDHAGLAHWLCGRFGLAPWMSQADYLTAHAIRERVAGYTQENLLDMYRRNGLHGDSLVKMAARGNSYARLVPAFPGAHRRIMDGEALSINGREWRVIMGHGHAPEHAALYCAELGTLISGDMLLPRISTNVSVWTIEPDGNPLRLFLDSIRRFTVLPPETLVLPSHGLPFRGMRERVAQLEAHHQAHFLELQEACERPLSAFDAIPTLFSRELDTHQLFFAMGESMAHLHYLWSEGLLDRRTGADGVYRFARSPDRN